MVKRQRVYGKVTAGGNLTSPYPLFEALWKIAHFNLTAFKNAEDNIYLSLHSVLNKESVFKTKYSEKNRP